MINPVDGFYTDYRFLGPHYDQPLWYKHPDESNEKYQDSISNALLYALARDKWKKDMSPYDAQSRLREIFSKGAYKPEYLEQELCAIIISAFGLTPKPSGKAWERGFWLAMTTGPIIYVNHVCDLVLGKCACTKHFRNSHDYPGQNLYGRLLEIARSEYQKRLIGSVPFSTACDMCRATKETQALFYRKENGQIVRIVFCKQHKDKLTGSIQGKIFIGSSVLQPPDSWTSSRSSSWGNSTTYASYTKEPKTEWSFMQIAKTGQMKETVI